MKKTFILFLSISFIASICVNSNLYASNNTNTPSSSKVHNIKLINQVYLQNKYVIDQLEMLTRSVKRQPHNIVTSLQQVSSSLLVIKLNSLNYLIKKQTQENQDFLYLPLQQKLILTEQGLFQQSQKMLQILPSLFKEYKQPQPAPFSQKTTLGWFTPEVTKLRLYQQLLEIESFIYGLENVFKSKRVYEVMQSIHTMLTTHCSHRQQLKRTPLVMGKRPRDVYLHLFNYLDVLSQFTTFAPLTYEPIHIFPHDVHDVAIVAFAYSRALSSNEEYKTIRRENNDVEFISKLEQSTIITPSHVYQAVSQNIALLECMKHANP